MTPTPDATNRDALIANLQRAKKAATLEVEYRTSNVVRWIDEAIAALSELQPSAPGGEDAILDPQYISYKLPMSEGQWDLREAYLRLFRLALPAEADIRGWAITAAQEYYGSLERPEETWTIHGVVDAALAAVGAVVSSHAEHEHTWTVSLVASAETYYECKPCGAEGVADLGHIMVMEPGNSSSPAVQAGSENEVEALADLLADLRDTYPRRTDDMPSDELATALHAAGYRKAPTVDEGLRDRVEALEVPLPNGYQFLRLGKAGADAVIRALSSPPHQE